MHGGVRILLSVVAFSALLSAQRPDRFRVAMPPIAELGPATFSVTGIDGMAVPISAADLYRLPQQTVSTADHGVAVAFQGVLLTDVLARVPTPVGETLRKTAASYYVLAEGADGYKAVFSWAEIDPSFSDRRMYVVTKRDGKPLVNDRGPFELIVPGDKRASRWVHQLSALKILQQK
jgi:hypothetical protein